MIVVIFTTSYPYDYIDEKTFHGGEVAFLQKHFERVIYVPRNAKGNLQLEPSQVEINTSLSRYLSSSRQLINGLLSIFTKPFWEDIKVRFPSSLSIGYLRRLISFLSVAYLTRQWVLDWFKKENVCDEDVIFYTFWFDEISMGIGLAKDKYPNLRLITKAHGFDIYEEIYKPWPCRRQALSLLDCLFADSNVGKEYFYKKYPDFRGIYNISLLGVPKQEALSKPSNDGIVRIVSCSTTASLKRLELIIEGINTAALKRPHQKFEWRHFGDGPDIENHIQRVKNLFPENASGYFLGYTSGVDLMHNYLTNPVDVFINTSKTEGTSVAIMEAISCGIPVIATAVGGNVEIVSEENGFLLTANPTPDEIADVLFKICDQSNEMLKKRECSYKIWEEKYNEKINFEAFAQALVEIRKR